MSYVFYSYGCVIFRASRLRLPLTTSVKIYRKNMYELQYLLLGENKKKELI